VKLTISFNDEPFEPADTLADPGPIPPPATFARRDEPAATLANVGEPLAGLCRRAEALCRLVAPIDLAGLPLYLVPQSAIRGAFGDAEETYGYTLNWLDLILQDQLGSAWRGRGPCIVANDIAMRQDLGNDIESTFLATVLHELAHVFERDMRYGPALDASPARMQFEGLRLAQIISEPVPESDHARTIHQHDLRFIRALLHLRHRAERHGVRLAPGILFNDGPAVYITPIEYRLALEDEPEQMFDASIRSILAAPPPSLFVRLWNDEREFLTRQFQTRKETHR
jgi:hypothetical protein